MYFAPRPSRMPTSSATIGPNGPLRTSTSSGTLIAVSCPGSTRPTSPMYLSGFHNFGAIGSDTSACGAPGTGAGGSTALSAALVMSPVSETEPATVNAAAAGLSNCSVMGDSAALGSSQAASVQPNARQLVR